MKMGLILATIIFQLRYFWINIHKFVDMTQKNIVIDKSIMLLLLHKRGDNFETKEAIQDV